MIGCCDVIVRGEVAASGPCSRTWAAQPPVACCCGLNSAQSVKALCRSATPVREPKPPSLEYRCCPLLNLRTRVQGRSYFGNESQRRSRLQRFDLLHELCDSSGLFRRRQYGRHFTDLCVNDADVRLSQLHGRFENLVLARVASNQRSQRVGPFLEDLNRS
jgi:hypothetical protein